MMIQRNVVCWLQFNRRVFDVNDIEYFVNNYTNVKLSHVPDRGSIYLFVKLVGNLDDLNKIWFYTKILEGKHTFEKSKKFHWYGGVFEGTFTGKSYSPLFEEFGKIAQEAFDNLTKAANAIAKSLNQLEDELRKNFQNNKSYSRVQSKRKTGKVRSVP